MTAIISYTSSIIRGPIHNKNAAMGNTTQRTKT